jgi:hypothetical protein
MNSFKQALCVIVAFMLLVGGITFGYQFLGSKDSTGATVAAKPVDTGVQLKFFSKQILLPTELEVKTVGRVDFCFENDKAEPVSVRLDPANTQCDKVDMALLNAAEMKRLPTWPPAFVGPGQGPDFLDNNPSRWQELSMAGAATTIPAHAKGVIRISYTGDKIGLHQSAATLITQKPDDDSTKAVTRLDAGLMFTPVLMVDSEDFELPAIEAGSSSTASFSCWSPTRSHFTLAVRESTSDPHFTFFLRPLTAQELGDVVFKQIKHHNMHAAAKCGYKVTMVVQEVLNNKHLDPGVFQRKLLLKSDIASERALTVHGTVHGDIEVGDEDRPGRVVLGTFSADQGTTIDTPINAVRADVELKLVSVQPSYLRAQLHGPDTVAGTRHWTLTVTAPPHIPLGRLPKTSEVLLQIKGDHVSQMHVPIHGAAYE